MDYIFKSKPFDHQKERFLKYRDKEFHGHFWEQGTGKSKMIIDNAAWLYNTGKLNMLVIVAPNGVHRNWILNEIPAHLPDYVPRKMAYYASNMNKKEQYNLDQTMKFRDLKIIAINVEAMVTEKCRKFLKELILMNDAMLVIDESTVIKNHKAIRTKSLLKVSHLAKYRRILTGTPVTQGPLDLFTQFSFLDDSILPTSSYFAFRARYAELKEIRLIGKKPFQKIVGYRNLEDLMKYIEPHCDRVTKKECLDLPDKLFQKHYVDLSDKQRRLYSDFKKELLVEFEGSFMSAPLALTKLLRLQQIVGGFFQADMVFEIDENGDPILHGTSPPVAIDEENPRVKAVVEVLENTVGKAIIWARFRTEIAAIVESLQENFGKDAVVEYHGGIKNTDRSENIRRFQEDDEVRFFVGNVQTGGRGLTLHAASTVIYYSNDFSLENRLQSEDRAHRIGQKNNVTYIDLIATGTLDEKVVGVLRDKKNVADLLTGDEPLSSWL